GHDVGRDEKQAWAAPLEMDGNLIWFAFRKFGVSATVYGVGTEEAAADIVADCMRRMGKAIPVVNRDLIEPLIAEAVTQGAFTVLEHLLVIGLAFTEYDPLQEPFGDFLRMNWGEKFKRVVGLKDKDGKLIYDTLRLLADENRNSSAHGGVDRNVANVHVHLVG